MARGFRARLRGRWLFIVVGAVCGAALLLEAILVPSMPNPTPPGSTGWATGPYVSVVDVDLIPTYDTTTLNDTSFLSEADCGCGPLNLTPGSTFGWWLRIGNSDPVNQTLLRVAVDGPFTLASTTPATPLTLPAGGNVTVTLFIRTPSTGGAYVVSGSVWVS